MVKTTSPLPKEVQGYFNRVLLKRSIPTTGGIMTFRRYSGTQTVYNADGTSYQQTIPGDSMSEEYKPNVPRESALKRFMRWFKPNHTATDIVRLERILMHQAGEIRKLSAENDLAYARGTDMRESLTARFDANLAELWTAVKVLEHTATQREHTIEIADLLSKQDRIKLRKTHEMIESFGEGYGEKELWVKRKAGK